MGGTWDTIEKAVVDAASGNVSTLESLVVLDFSVPIDHCILGVPSVPSHLRRHPWIMTILIDLLQVQWPLLEEQVSLGGIHHVVGRHLVPVKRSATVLAEEPPDRYLRNKCVAAKAFLRGVVFIHTNNNVPK